MMCATRLLFCFSLLCLSLCSAAQQFGGNPPSLKWNQINTDTARIIFPVGLEAQAQEVARIVHQLARTTQHTIGDRVRKISIVMQNQTTISNGYVALGPYRSEFFLTPTQNSFELGSLPWHKTLALHEYRHVQQNNNFRKGLTKAFYYAFGEEGQALASNLAVPDWFWEGDAVFQETLTSTQGRGRIPFFFNDFRSLWAAGKDYSWMKLRNGSYLDLTPDHYRLGYLLVAYGRKKFGDTVWSAVTDKASRFTGPVYPFQSAFRKITGGSFSRFRNEAMNYFRRQQDTAVKDAPSTFAAQHRHFDADEEYPQWIDKKNIVYVKTSYRKIPAFYIKNTETSKEKRIRIKDVSNDNYFSFRNGKIVYAAIRPDARWTWKNFGVINVVDLASGKQKTITKRTKYFSPDISASGKTIAAVQMEPSGKNSIHFLDARNGNVVSVMPNHNKYIFTYPKFYNDEQIVAAVRDKTGEMALGLFDIRTGTPHWLTAFSMRAIAFPQVNGDTITFSMSEGNREKLFAVIDGELNRFVPEENNESTGSYQLSVGNGKAVYNCFTAVGYHLYVGEARFERTAPIVPHAINSVYASTPGTHPNLVPDSPAVAYRISKYPAAYRLFNFHSWRPYISDPEYSYSLESENILNTLQSEVFVTYNRNERFKEMGASLAYAGWFPVISGGAAYIFDRSAIDNANHPATWNEFNANVGANLPLAFTSGSFNQSLNLSSSFNAQQIRYTGASKDLYSDKKFNYAEVSLSAVNRQITVRQQIYPRFAQTLYARYRSVVNKYSASQLLLSGAIYLPGLSANHSVVIQAAYQRRDTMNQYSFTNGFPLARGYSNINLPRMWKLGVNYHFPIVYPDWGFADIFFLQRIRGNAYFDYAELKSLRFQTVSALRSVGAELYFDSKWWNQLPVSFGIRYSRLLDSDPAGRSANQWELVLPLNLLSR